MPFRFTAGAVLRRPMQFGPDHAHSRSPHQGEKLRLRAWLPPSPVSENPAEITESPRTPFWAHSAATSKHGFGRAPR